MPPSPTPTVNIGNIANITKAMLLSSLALGAAACSAAPANHKQPQVPETNMSDTLRGHCVLASAKIALVDEALMTRAALSPERAEEVGKVTELRSGDARLQKLTAVLDGASPTLSDAPSVDARLVVRLTCQDGSERVIAGSMSGDTGMFVTVGGKAYKLPATFRKDMEALVG